MSTISQWKRALLVLGLSAAILAGGMGLWAFGSAAAQTSTPDAQPTAVAPEAAAPKVGPRGGKGVGPDGGDSTALAAALGITTEELTTARQTAVANVLQQAVAEGLLTQAQADAISARGVGRMDGMLGGWMKQSGWDFVAKYQTALADALGITPAALQTAQAQVAYDAIVAALDAGRITADQAELAKARYALSHSATFQDALQSAYASAIQAAVAEGTITQAQADLILAQAANGRGFGGFDGHDFGGGMMERGGHGGRGGFPPAGDTTAPQAPSAAQPSGTGL
jgi:hypothetical protein